MVGCLDETASEAEAELEAAESSEANFRFRISRKCLKRMAKRSLRRLAAWLLEVEMGFVWGTAGLAIIIFVFAAIWYIDPALLTLVLRFRPARCVTKNQAFLIGISNCSWTSCRLGCTKEIYQCWQIQVEFEYIEGTKPYEPPWASVSVFDRGGLYNADYSNPQTSPASNTARLYPNVRGCGYPPELNCEEFYEFYKHNETDYECWVSTMDSSVAITGLDLERAKSEVLFSLIPLLIFIVFVLYAFCRMGVFSVCNPMRMCPASGPNARVDLPGITPKKLMNYKRGLMAKKTEAMEASFDYQEEEQQPQTGPDIPDTIYEDPAREAMEADTPATASSSRLKKSSSKKLVVTSAEVLPRRPSASDSASIVRSRLKSSKLASEAVTTASSSAELDNFDLLSVFNADSKSETNTIINELFGEELEKMDRERLASHYDVIDLKELDLDHSFNSVLRPQERSGSKRPPKKRVKSPDSFDCSWDDPFDELAASMASSKTVKTASKASAKQL